MGKIDLLDCTLRDGGYVNDWNFGEEIIRDFCQKIARTGVEICEVGFLRGDKYDCEKTLFPDLDTIRNVIQPKCDHMLYFAMLDMKAPIPRERFVPCDGTSIDGVRVIFKKDKINEAYDYCSFLQKQGYLVSVNIVQTDLYTDKEFLDVIELFSGLMPYAVSIVDTFGIIKQTQFLRLVYLADNNLRKGIALGYHAHNNLQQAFGNAEALVKMHLDRDVIIDACVFGMGRGAGNLNLELFAEFMNENYDTAYDIGPMLEIFDEYLRPIFAERFWGYSLPYYLSAKCKCHPNYAKVFSEKNTLTNESMMQLLSSLPDDVKISFSEEKAEYYYSEFVRNDIDDRSAVEQLKKDLRGRNVLILSPGKSIRTEKKKVDAYISEHDCVTIAVGMLPDSFRCDYLFCSNERRFKQIQDLRKCQVIVTSNIHPVLSECIQINYASYLTGNGIIAANPVLMVLRLLISIGVKEVALAGFDGYSLTAMENYYDPKCAMGSSIENKIERNSLISKAVREMSRLISMNFITKSKYIN